MEVKMYKIEVKRKIDENEISLSTDVVDERDIRPQMQELTNILNSYPGYLQNKKMDCTPCYRD